MRPPKITPIMVKKTRSSTSSGFQLEPGRRARIRPSHHAAARIAELPGLSVSWPTFFKEFVVDFGATGYTVKEVNDRLRERGIFGGGR